MFAAGCFVIDYRPHAYELRQTLPSHVQPLGIIRRLGGVAGFEQGCLVAWSDLEVLRCARSHSFVWGRLLLLTNRRYTTKSGEQNIHC